MSGSVFPTLSANDLNQLKLFRLKIVSQWKWVTFHDVCVREYS